MIIGIVGFKQVGKSTAAKYLEDKYGFARHNFKDALVQELKDNFPDLLKEIAYTRDWDNGMESAIEDLFIKKPPLMRALMINYGTEVRRKDNPHYWTGQWSQALCPELDTVTDDVRFLNEAEAIKIEGGIIIRLTRPDLLTGGDHVSETEQLEIVADHTIECDPGDLVNLYRQLDDMVRF